MIGSIWSNHWLREPPGKLPLEDMIQSYPFGDMDKALEDVKDGKVIKPALVC